MRHPLWASGSRASTWFLFRSVNKEMNILLLFVTILFATVAVGPSAGLYFHIRETEEKCFIEEVPDETMVVGT